MLDCLIGDGKFFLWVGWMELVWNALYAFEAIDFAIWFHPLHVISIFTVQEKLF